MSDSPAWLSSLVLFSDYEGDWNRYLDALYMWFRQDFIDSKPVFQGQRLGLKRYPLSHGKEATFWHIISEGKNEDDRLPDFRRCERIRWPKQVKIAFHPVEERFEVLNPEILKDKALVIILLKSSSQSSQRFSL